MPRDQERQGNNHPANAPQDVELSRGKDISAVLIPTDHLPVEPGVGQRRDRQNERSDLPVHVDASQDMAQSQELGLWACTSFVSGRSSVIIVVVDLPAGPGEKRPLSPQSDEQKAK